VKSDDKGLLIPRLTYMDRNNISSPATGLLVFQTNGYVGFHYNAGTPSAPDWIQLSTTLITELADTDDDTKVHVEKYTDEDMIRLNIAGTESWVFINKRLEPRNSGNSTFVGYHTGHNDDNTSNNNSFFGFYSGGANTSGYDNSFAGYRSGKYNTTGYQNTAFGSNSLYTNTTGFGNTTFGYSSLYYNQTGDNNVAIGYEAGKGTTLHNKSGGVFIGYQAGAGDEILFLSI